MNQDDDNENENPFQKFWSWLRAAWKSILPRSRKDKDPILDGKKQFARDLQIIFRTGSAVDLKTFFLNHFEVLGAIFEERGRHDGRKEINPKLAADFISSEAREIQGVIRGVFQSRSSVAHVNKTARENRYNVACDELKTQEDYVESIEKKYRFDFGTFALFIGILYVIFSLGFLIADFPLSRLIVQQGFEITNPIESFLLTIGITLIGVYFKIWWDEYINPGVEKLVTKNRINNLEGFEEIPAEEQAKAIDHVKRARIGQLILKTSVLVTALVSIGILGYFRYTVYIYNQFELKQLPVPPALGSFSAISGFIFISLLFPFLGGICLSIGTNKIQNWRERRSAKRQLKRRSKEFAVALKEKEIAERELAACSEYLEWCTEDLFDECRDLLRSRYNRGYDIGLTDINYEMDTLAKAERVRKRMLGRRTYIKTQPMVDEDFFERTGQTS